jgi:hypothetical protein
MGRDTDNGIVPDGTLNLTYTQLLGERVKRTTEAL